MNLSVDSTWTNPLLNGVEMVKGGEGRSLEERRTGGKKEIENFF